MSLPGICRSLCQRLRRADCLRLARPRSSMAIGSVPRDRSRRSPTASQGITGHCWPIIGWVRSTYIPDTITTTYTHYAGPFICSRGHRRDIKHYICTLSVVSQHLWTSKPVPFPTRAFFHSGMVVELIMRTFMNTQAIPWEAAALPSIQSQHLLMRPTIGWGTANWRCNCPSFSAVWACNTQCHHDKR